MPQEAGDWIASPLPSPIARATAPAQETGAPPADDVVPEAAEAEAAADQSTAETAAEAETATDQPAAEAAAEAETATDQPAAEAEPSPAVQSAEASFTGVDEPPADAETEETREEDEAPTHPEEAPEPTVTLPPPVEAAQTDTFPFRLEPNEPEVAGGSVRRAVDALRTVIAAKRRAVPGPAPEVAQTAATGASPTSAAEIAGEGAREPPRPEEPAAPEPAGSEPVVPETAALEPPGAQELAPPESTPATEARPSAAPARPATGPVPTPAASLVSPDEVPVVLPAAETWAERLVPLRIALQRQWKGLVAVPILLLVGFLVLRAATGGGFDSASVPSAEPPATSADLDRFETLRDALETSLSLYAERRADFSPGEAGCIALSVAYGSATRDHEVLRAFIADARPGLPDVVHDEWRRLDAAMEEVGSDFDAAGCGR